MFELSYLRPKAAHPRWPATTRYIFHGACQAGRGHLLGRRRASCALGTYSFRPPAAVGTSARAPACSTSAPAAAAAVRAALHADTPRVWPHHRCSAAPAACWAPVCNACLPPCAPSGTRAAPVCPPPPPNPRTALRARAPLCKLACVARCQILSHASCALGSCFQGGVAHAGLNMAQAPTRSVSKHPSTVVAAAAPVPPWYYREASEWCGARNRGCLSQDDPKLVILTPSCKREGTKVAGR